MTGNKYGTITVESADIPRSLRRLSEEGITVNNVTMINEFEAVLYIKKEHIIKSVSVLLKNGDQVTKRSSFPSVFQVLKRRIVLIGTLIILLMLTIWIPTRVFFIFVEGNSYVPDQRILEAAKSSGIYFGAKRVDVRSEEIKNRMLESVPQLQWTGINTSGCIAKISVKEKAQGSTVPLQTDIEEIVALRDGIICSATATEGTLLCKVGQAVTKGQTLVSGYADVGLDIIRTQPKAEIYALTTRTVNLCALCRGAERNVHSSVKKNYSIQIGKNFLKMYNGSGIYPPGCVKMYDRIECILPGGFVLPISLIVETVTYAELTKSVVDTCQEHPWMKDFSGQYISSQMVAGSILTGDARVSCRDGVAYVDGMYVCREMICVNKEHNEDDE